MQQSTKCFNFQRPVPNAGGQLTYCMLFTAYLLRIKWQQKSCSEQLQ